MKIYDYLRNSTREIRYEILKKFRLSGTYKFENRSSNNRKLCIVLAGYKKQLYPSVFGRIEKYAPLDVDICVVSSGVYSQELSRLCKDHNWSYLSTKKNNISLIQNITIMLFSNAEYIYKLDEDIFITEKFFENMYRAYQHAEQGCYDIGVIAPLIPINGYGNYRILEKLNLLKKYESLFEKPIYSTDPNRLFRTSEETAKFFWGENNLVPSIDDMNRKFSCEPIQEHPCPIRFSIGAIMFKRTLWEDMSYYPVFKGRILGVDEDHINAFCCNHSRPIMVSENVVVGHFSYSQQFKAMKELYCKKPHLFMP